MALGAMAANPGVRVKIIPVGLSYFHAHRFRSRGVVEFGSAIDVPDELVELFKQGGEQKRQASSKLLDVVYEALKTVTIRTPDYETLMVRLFNYGIAEYWLTFVCLYMSSVSPGGSKTVQNPWPAFNSWAGRRTQ